MKTDMYIDNKFNIGDTVYLKTDDEQRPYLVLEIYVGLGALSYKIANDTRDYTAYEFEMSAERDILAKINL